MNRWTKTLTTTLPPLLGLAAIAALAFFMGANLPPRTTDTPDSLMAQCEANGFICRETVQVYSLNGEWMHFGRQVTPARCEVVVPQIGSVVDTMLIVDGRFGVLDRYEHLTLGTCTPLAGTER